MLYPNRASQRRAALQQAAFLHSVTCTDLRRLPSCSAHPKFASPPEREFQRLHFFVVNMSVPSQCTNWKGLFLQLFCAWGKLLCFHGNAGEVPLSFQWEDTRPLDDTKGLKCQRKITFQKGMRSKFVSFAGYKEDVPCQWTGNATSSLDQVPKHLNEAHYTSYNLHTDLAQVQKTNNSLKKKKKLELQFTWKGMSCSNRHDAVQISSHDSWCLALDLPRLFWQKDACSRPLLVALIMPSSSDLSHNLATITHHRSHQPEWSLSPRDHL